MEKWIHLELTSVDDQLMCDKCGENFVAPESVVIYQDKWHENSSVYCSECWDVLSGRKVIEDRKNESH